METGFYQWWLSGFNKICFFTLFFSSLFFSSQSLAWTGTGEITEVYSHDGLHIINTTINGTPCSRQFYWPTSDPDAKDMFTLALAAFMGGKTISVHYSSLSCNAGIGNAVLITHLKIIK
ncbi:hypothetical protein MED121_22592 [Marinomonas sp. MED121]|uniref:hypothetical protein n=1 Tax=Marinomonas sp. MED121 TaxID=314277 RepID=UPI000068FDE1|nr:hypothetical protein [Marinomonas sp. MED121]EAQ65508.1 hypothetical protein MED121_22592 [Marinomonas sp. MED121]